MRSRRKVGSALVCVGYFQGSLVRVTLPHQCEELQLLSWLTVAFHSSLGFSHIFPLFVTFYSFFLSGLLTQFFSCYECRKL